MFGKDDMNCITNICLNTCTQL